MNIVSIDQISKSYGEKILFDQITFGIEENEKIGVIGINGTGKSTLLKTIAGLEQPEQGSIIKGNHVRIEYVPQLPEFDETSTVLQQIFKGYSPVMKVLREYEMILEQIQNAPDDQRLQQKFMEISHKMDEHHAWQLESEAKQVLTQLGITNFQAQIGTLSGGQRKRIALAGALIGESELLILDEPTNHIDPETVEWLEQYLKKRKGAVLLITHDRYFLDRVVTRMLELDKGKLYSYDGNYTQFLTLKAEREANLVSSERKRQNFLRKELEWVRRGAKARTTKQKARLDRYDALSSEKMETVHDQIDISVSSSRLGKKIIEMHQITHAFGERAVIRDFTYTFLREDRIGIVGRNGSGKSTLLKIIQEEITPDAGSVEIGKTVRIGYFAQDLQEWNENLRVIDYLKQEGEYVTTADGTQITASQMLERFLFPVHLQWSPISKLSGGEKRRLYLLRILLSAPNVLLFDEPTNDLDIQTLSILEEYLDDFSGVVIIVSHDRFFLDRTVDKVFAYEGDGKIRQFMGNYSEYLDVVAGEAIQPTTQPTLAKKSQEEQRGEREKKERPAKFTYKEQKEFEQIEALIEALEQRLETIEIDLGQVGADFTKAEQLFAEKQQVEQELEEKMERWAYLNEMAEMIGK